MTQRRSKHNNKSELLLAACCHRLGSVTWFGAASPAPRYRLQRNNPRMRTEDTGKDSPPHSVQRVAGCARARCGEQTEEEEDDDDDEDDDGGAV
ncbi:uncharacterized [Tachysurus ichikawai]